MDNLFNQLENCKIDCEDDNREDDLKTLKNGLLIYSP